MNTPAHMLINTAILKAGGDQRIFWYVMIGSCLPDAWMFLAGGIDLLVGYEFSEIWQRYYDAFFWYGPNSFLNSIPLIALGVLITHITKQRILFWILAGMFLHVFADFFVHNHDAHKHLWPLTDWRFLSPISYWDPAHHGHVVGIIEMGFALCAGLLLLRVNLQKSQRFFVRLLMVTELIGLTGMVMLIFQ